MTPSALITPARYSSAIASMIPEPQIPVIPVDVVDSGKAGSSDQWVLPMTLKRGSRVTGSMRRWYSCC